MPLQTHCRPRMGAANSTSRPHSNQSTPLLPNECLLLVLRQCDGSTLKNARLASKTLARLSEPLLWRTLRLIPNTDCLACIGDVLRRSSIACHVQNVIYDASWEYLIDDFRIKSDKIAIDEKASAVSGGNVPSIKVLRQAILAQIKAGEDGAAEVAYLTKFLRNLSNLHELTVKESFTTFEALDCMPHYYQKVCKDAGVPNSELRLSGGLGPADTGHSHTRNMLLAAYSIDRDFDIVDLRSVSWHTFFRMPIDAKQPPTHDFRIRKEMFRKIKQLDLSFRGSPSRDFETNLKPLRDLLKSCDSLESLYLSFTNLINRRYSTDNRSFSYLSPLISDSRLKPLMPQLREMYLNSVFCTEHDLVHFLANHASTLRHVSLSNISLLKNDLSDNRGCWVQVIKFMKALLSLNTVYFSGWLSNGGRQIWHVSEDAADDDRLRPAVIRYLTNKNIQDCPLDHVAIRADHEDLEKPRSGWHEGDWTWTMTYASYKSRGEQTHSGAQLFSKNVAIDADDWAIANPHLWKNPYKKTYPSYLEPYPSKKTSPNSSSWSWSDYGPATTWPADSKKGKQKAVAANSTTTMWGDWSTHHHDDAFFFDAPPTWDAPPPVQAAHSSSSGNESPHSASSQGSESNEASSFANVDPGYQEDEEIVVDFSAEPPAAPTDVDASWINAPLVTNEPKTCWNDWGAADWAPSSISKGSTATSTNGVAKLDKDTVHSTNSYTYAHSWDWAPPSNSVKAPDNWPKKQAVGTSSSHHNYTQHQIQQYSQVKADQLAFKNAMEEAQLKAQQSLQHQIQQNALHHEKQKAPKSSPPAFGSGPMFGYQFTQGSGSEMKASAFTEVFDGN